MRSQAVFAFVKIKIALALHADFFLSTDCYVQIKSNQICLFPASIYSDTDSYIGSTQD